MTRDGLRGDLQAAVTSTMMAVPQGVAYAVIAGLPPAAGLYAAALPTIIGSLVRSSNHVVTGPTNALSLLVGAALLGLNPTLDPWVAATSLALLVGVFQVAAGLLRLGAVVGYISRAVVLGYVTGAGLLIGFGQLGNLTGTPMGRGDPWTRLNIWLEGLGGTDPRTVALGLGTLAVLLALRRWAPKAPGPVVVLVLGIALSWLFDFRGLGIATAGDLAPVPLGLPPLTVPVLDWSVLRTLLPAAIAATVLSLVEASAVARSLAAESGQRLDMDREFVGQGMGNLTAAFTGGYPVSGSLSRSGLSLRSGATSRMSGVFSGLLMLGVLLVAGPLVDLTPIASLAGLLLLVAWNLVDQLAIRTVWSALPGDRFAFLGTLVGTWTLSLDTAIYLGVGISLILFLRRVRNLRVTELVVRGDRLREVDADQHHPHCSRVVAIHIEGNLFFGAANELQEALDDATRDARVKVLVVRLKRARGLDFTTAGVLRTTRERLVGSGRHLLLAGMKPETMALLDDVGLTETFGEDALFPTQTEWFHAMNAALVRGHALAGSCDDCPLAKYLPNR